MNGIKAKTIFSIVLASVCFKAEAQSSALKIADSLYASGNYSNAINQYAKVGTPRASQQIAKAYNVIGNFEKAILQYESVVAKDSSLILAKFELGKLYVKIKDNKKATSVFQKLVFNQPNNPEFYYYLGRSSTDLEERLKAYKKAVKIDSTHLRSIFKLGKYYVVKREKDSVLKYVNKGLSFYSSDVSLINLKALAYFNNANYEEAAILFERLLELKEYKEHVYEKLGHSYLKELEIYKAKKAYLSTLEINDENERILNGLGDLYLKEKQLDSSEYYFKESIKVQHIVLDKEYMSLARIARIRNDIPKAIFYYKLAFKEDTSNFRSYYQICVLYDQYSKDSKGKLRYYERFIEKFGTKKGYFSLLVKKRIAELKEEGHVSKK